MKLCDICRQESTNVLRLEFPALCDSCLASEPEPPVGLKGQISDEEVARLEASLCAQESGSMVILTRKSVIDLFERLRRLERAVAFAGRAQLKSFTVDGLEDQFHAKSRVAASKNELLTPVADSHEQSTCTN